MEPTVIYCTSCGTPNGNNARFCYKCGAPIGNVEKPAPVTPRSDFVSLSCPNCGGKLEITADMERFTCKYCGSEHMVRRSGGAISLAPVVDGLKRVESKFDQVLMGSDRMAAEQTIRRLKEEIQELEQEITRQENHIRSMPHPSTNTSGEWLKWVGVTGALLIFISLFLMLALSKGATIIHLLSINTLSIIYFSAFLICLIFINIGRRSAGSKKRKIEYEQRLEQARSALAKSQTELLERKQQLAQLQKYTVGR
jgi:DNA-directed RNA polymerase subunit RPC12/RpoP